ncbi:hypothetical protein CsSME_00035127 [Camellia sinensis var. sinensis]
MRKYRKEYEKLELESLLLAREGINAEQFARDLKSFELKMTIEDVFPAEATIVEEYLQQVNYEADGWVAHQVRLFGLYGKWVEHGFVLIYGRIILVLWTNDFTVLGFIHCF